MVPGHNYACIHDPGAQRYECPDLCFKGWFQPIKKKKRRTRRMRKKEEKDKEGEKGKRKMERRRNQAIIQNI